MLSIKHDYLSVCYKICEFFNAKILTLEYSIQEEQSINQQS